MSTLTLVVRNTVKFCILTLITANLCACGTSDAKIIPGTSSNACQIFKQNPQWYWDSLETYNHWGVPISVQMAIIQRESDFQAGAKTPKKKFLGIIPTFSHITSAYGYAQAVNGTWQQYQRETRNSICYRTQYKYASDFIGWYSYKAHERFGISLKDAYHLYLAYHEGLNGYAQQTYLQNPALLSIARSVQYQANQYKRQIHSCKYSIPKDSSYWW